MLAMLDNSIGVTANVHAVNVDGEGVL
jgi:hypothetical protein